MTRDHIEIFKEKLKKKRFFRRAKKFLDKHKRIKIRRRKKIFKLSYVFKKSDCNLKGIVLLKTYVLLSDLWYKARKGFLSNNTRKLNDLTPVDWNNEEIFNEELLLDSLTDEE